jgi:hypothetical protein
VDASSIWVGIGGLNGDQTLIQVGTEQDASATGATTYYAWYETLPGTKSACRRSNIEIADFSTGAARLM